MSVALLGSLWRPGLPPGVYEERPVQTVRTRVRLDVAAFVGLAERGPVNTPVAIDDIGQFEAVFGPALPGLALALAVRLFFANGGRRCLAVRCVDHPDVRTTRLLLPGLRAVRGASRRQVRIAARNPGRWGNRLQVRCSLVQRPVALGFDPLTGALRIPADRPARGATLRLSARPTSAGGTPRTRFFRVAEDSERRPILLPAPSAPFRDPGLLGAAVELTLRLEVFLDGKLVERWDDGALHPDHARFLPRLLGRRCAAEALLPPRIDVADPQAPAAEADRVWGDADDPWGSAWLRPSAQLTNAWLLPTRALLDTPAGVLLSAADMPPSRHGRDASASTTRAHFFAPTSMHADDAAEDADHRFVAFSGRPGALDALASWDQGHPFEPVALVALPDLLHPQAPATLSVPPTLPDERCFAAACTRGEAERSVHALDYPRLGFDAADLQRAQLELVRHCEAHGARIALIDLPPGLRAADVVAWRHALASARAALYSPWLRVDAGGHPANVPPAAAAAGIAAAVENDTGVWAAPANRALRGVFALADDGALPPPGFLFEERVDEIRRTERGLMLLGARTTSTSGEWTHLSVRRLIDWLKAQLAADLAWAPFEPNDAVLWAAMAGTARRRLAALFDAGALAGRSAADAFFVRCDASTHTQADLDGGRAVLKVGVAAAVPAEFIVFRLVRSGADDPRIEVH